MEQIFYSTNKFSSLSDILNAAIEAGLKVIQNNDLSPSSFEEIVKKEVKKSIDTQYRCTKKLMLQIKKLTILESVQELMISSLLQEFEFYLKAQGVRLDDRMLEDFKASLPKRFEDDKQYFISTLMDNTSDNDNKDEEL